MEVQYQTFAVKFSRMSIEFPIRGCTWAKTLSPPAMAFPLIEVLPVVVDSSGLLQWTQARSWERGAVSEAE